MLADGTPPPVLLLKDKKQMDKHVFLCETESEYESLVYETPHVALTEDDDTVHYDKPKIIVNGYEFVDMGLSVDWATCNIGAESPEKNGWYFMWGDTVPYTTDRTPMAGGDAITFSWNSNCPHWVSGTASFETKWSKYTATDGYSSTGVKDDKLILESEDDAAYMHIGEECRTPTKEEYQELLNACNSTWTTKNNIRGYLFTLKTDPSKTLFFPASGYLAGTGWKSYSSYGYYWLSSLDSSDSSNGDGMFFSSISCSRDCGSRCQGRPIRAVLPK